MAVVWTSGTTGLPKGAVFDHASLAAVAEGTDVLSEAGDRRLSPLPFAHVGSMTRPWDEIANGVTTVITPTPWKAADAIRIMTEERITVAQGVPTQWALVLAHPDLDAADLSSLRIAGTGASRVPSELVAAMRQRLGVPVVVRYTSTEASLGTGTVPGDPDEVVATTRGPAGPRGASWPSPTTTGRAVPAGEVGRVRLRSGCGDAGLLGWTHDGSGSRRHRLRPAGHRCRAGRGRVADHRRLRLHRSGGCLHLVGRANELYIRGGYNVYPAEVEGVLGGHPAVAQVAVVGAPDPVLGEIGVAFVVPIPEAPSAPDELLAALRELARASLADYKAPDRLVLVDSLPLTSMMKVDKRSLAERAELAARRPDRRPADPAELSTTTIPERSACLMTGRSIPAQGGVTDDPIRIGTCSTRWSSPTVATRSSTTAGTSETTSTPAARSAPTTSPAPASWPPPR